MCSSDLNSGDIDERNCGGDDLLGLEDSGEGREARIGHSDHSNVGLNRGEWVVRSQDIVLRQGIEKRRLTHVWESDDSD